MEETEVVHILIMNEMLDLYDERRELKRLRHLYMTKQLAVPTLHNDVRMELRSTRKNWIGERCDAMKKGMKAGNSKESYDTLMISPKPNSREQLSSIIMIVS